MISIILVNFNNSNHTIDCLKSLQNQKFENFEIILVENNSKIKEKIKIFDIMKSNQLKRSFMKKIKIIHSKQNLGYAGGNNLGIQKSKGDLILLLNSDTFHDSDFLDSMYIFFQKYKNIHITQPRICYFSEKDTIWQDGGKINVFSFNLFNPVNSLKKEKDCSKKPFKIDYAIGCALFIRREIFKKIKLLDVTYFMYGEESDLCYRAKIRGYNNIYCNPKIKIYHNCERGFSISFKKYYFRNRLIFCFKFLPLYLLIWQFILQFIQLIIFTIDFKNKRIDYYFFILSLKGILNGLNTGFIKRITHKKLK